MRENEVAFREIVHRDSSKDNENTIKSKTATLAKADRRIAELDRIIKRIYEDHVAEKLSDERFSKMLGDYEAEQSELVSGTEALRIELEEIRSKTADIQSFINLVERCSDVSQLTADMARSFVERIVVHEAELIPNARGHKSRTQQVDIFLNFIGEFNSK